MVGMSQAMCVPGATRLKHTGNSHIAQECLLYSCIVAQSHRTYVSTWVIRLQEIAVGPTFATLWDGIR